MAKGDGSIQQLGRNKWRVSVSFGRDPITGKYRRATQVVNGTKAEAKKVRDGMIRNHENGLRLDASKVTFDEFARQWQAAKEASGRIGEQRIRMERRNVRDICARIGELPITEVTPQVVETVLDDIRAAKEGFARGGAHHARGSRHIPPSDGKGRQLRHYHAQPVRQGGDAEARRRRTALSKRF